jgi:hypothetical protein
MTTAGPENRPVPEHLPRRPEWLCEKCSELWPCTSARDDLMTAFPRTALAMYMTAQLGIAARDLPDALPAVLYVRFLSWTR